DRATARAVRGDAERPVERVAGGAVRVAGEAGSGVGGGGAAAGADEPADGGVGDRGARGGGAVGPVRGREGDAHADEARGERLELAVRAPEAAAGEGEVLHADVHGVGGPGAEDLRRGEPGARA